MAERSADGYYTLKGRADDLIISGGFNIYPAEIERFLREQPGVKEAVVVGAPDAIRGQTPIAFIEPNPGFDPAAIEKACRDSMASYKVPREFRRIGRAPRNALGKIQRRLLTELAASSSAPV